ncbi:MAG: phospholipid carrier-dependent glycosyltransferase [Candidatus Xenobia bacterium]
MAGVAFTIGVIFRAWYLYRLHPASHYLYSDMRLYVDMSQSFWTPRSMFDAFCPPGLPALLAVLSRWDPSLGAFVSLQFGLSVLIPWLLFDLASQLYDVRAGLWTLALSSLYFPFIDYAGYYLTENPCLFCIVLAAILALHTVQAEATWKAALWGLATGLSLGLAATFKDGALLTALLWLIYFATRHTRPLRLACGVIGLGLVLIPLCIRATAINEGHFCLLDTHAPVTVLMGHYGDVVMFDFHDTERHLNYTCGGPAALQQHPEARRASFPFGCYDGRRCLEAAWGWIRAHPLDALLASLHNVSDLFVDSVPWPTSHTAYRRWEVLSQEVYWVVILLPASFGIWLRVHKGESIAIDMFLLLPLLGLMATVFLSLGEPRYRIPYDGFTIILAARTWAETRTKAAS